MKASKIHSLAIAGGLLLATASSSMAITLTGTGGSIDFDPTTVTFTNWVFNSVNALAPAGLSYTGFVLNPVPVTSILTADQSLFQYSIGGSPTAPMGLLTINFLGDTLAMDFNALGSDDLTQTANFLVGYEQVVTVTNDSFGGDFVVPTEVGTTLSWDLNNQLPVQFSSNITLTGSVIPEPITAALGMAGVMMLGMRLTGRRSR